jgi:cysteine-rich repeat protein
MSFDGCEPVKVVDVAGGGKQICCNCSHLTEFAASINTVRPACGDAKISDAEQCDDGNMVSGDGCHATACSIESGWACWSVPSVCCGACPLGSYRTECGVTLPNQPRTLGSCLPCPPGTFKNITGGWDTTCTLCAAGTYAVGGNTNCMPFQVCAAGTELSAMSTTAGGVCVACINGKFKNASMSSWDRYADVC